MTAAIDAWDRLFGAATGLAVAAGGAWEDAVRLPFGTGAPEDTGPWLARAGSDVAIEVAFDTGAFVGVRLRPDERSSAVNIVTALHSGLGTLADAGPVPASAAMERVERVVGPRFHHVRPDHAELGVLDRWQSLGHLRMELPVPMSPPTGAPGVPADAPGPIIMEIGFGPEADGWLGAPVSASVPGRGHRVDPARWRAVALLPTDLCVRAGCRDHP
ncbi:hypothetical protein CLV63_13016 [Murinocardiopsis flavida]|uniref:Uncharacterized protein n=1 Tax=Murinocardiopsis flavida TaxID=645275 RepID=A0A2P8CSW4_9ACTN|nr:hypothetical protein [Murinocardiopsis flavida]PSK88054.1 hypothetical protein CLV63_13016 [Murinocardiopsis flavida]